MIRKILTLAAAGILTITTAGIGTKANAAPVNALACTECNSSFLVQAWGPTRYEADNRAVELEASGYHRVSGIRFGYIPSAGVSAYYVLMAAD